MTTLTRLRIREITPTDVGRVLELTRATGVFRDEEMLIAEEVVVEAARVVASAPAERSYYTLGAEIDGRIAGWICWGATPCTVGTWDLYWMAVDPAAHGQGIGTALVEEMEHRLQGKARLIMIDTSGREDYRLTRAFYRARGYQPAAVVRDFYAEGDDQVIFSKRLP